MNTVTRKIDDLNRVVLPSQVKSFGWSEKTPLDITFCKLCGDAQSKLITMDNGCICEICLQIAMKNNKQ